MGNFAQQGGGADQSQLLQLLQQLAGGQQRSASFNQIPTGATSGQITPGLPDFWRQLEAQVMLRNTPTGRGYDPHGLLAFLTGQSGNQFGSDDFFSFYDTQARGFDPAGQGRLRDILGQGASQFYGGNIPAPIQERIGRLGVVPPPTPIVPVATSGGPQAPSGGRTGLVMNG